jgi:hypothetical protein
MTNRQHRLASTPTHAPVSHASPQRLTQGPSARLGWVSLRLIDLRQDHFGCEQRSTRNTETTARAPGRVPSVPARRASRVPLR